MKTYYYVFLLIIIMAAGCKNESDLDSNAFPKVFKIALSVANDDMPEEVFTKMEPMRLYLEKQLGIPVRYLHINGNSATIEAMKAKKIHMANLSPFPYLLARERAQVTVSFYMGKKNGKPTGEYRTAIFTKKDSNIKTIADLKAKSHELTIAFVDPASTSGHIIPYNFLLSQGIEPDKDFKKQVFANSTLACILTLYSGKVDVACVQTNSFRKVYSMNKNINDSSFNFLWISEPIPPTSYCLRNDLNPEFKKKVFDAYINVKNDTAAWGAIKHRLTSRSVTQTPIDSLCYLPINDSAYNDFAKMVKKTKGLKIE